MGCAGETGSRITSAMHYARRRPGWRPGARPAPAGRAAKRPGAGEWPSGSRLPGRRRGLPLRMHYGVRAAASTGESRPPGRKPAATAQADVEGAQRARARPARTTGKAASSMQAQDADRSRHVPTLARPAPGEGQYEPNRLQQPETEPQSGIGSNRCQARGPASGRARRTPWAASQAPAKPVVPWNSEAASPVASGARAHPNISLR